MGYTMIWQQTRVDYHLLVICCVCHNKWHAVCPNEWNGTAPKWYLTQTHKYDDDDDDVEEEEEKCRIVNKQEISFCVCVCVCVLKNQNEHEAINLKTKRERNETIETVVRIQYTSISWPWTGQRDDDRVEHTLYLCSTVVSCEQYFAVIVVVVVVIVSSFFYIIIITIVFVLPRSCFRNKSQHNL